MTKNQATLCGWAAALGSAAFMPFVVHNNFRGDEDTLSFISMMIISILAASVAMISESKKEKVSLQYILAMAFLNFVGLGMAIYELLYDNSTKTEEC